MSKGKFRLYRLIVIVLLFALGIALVLSKEEAKTIVKSILESNWPAVAVWLLAIIGVGADKLFSGSSIQTEHSFIYQAFGRYADAVFAAATYGIAGGTSLALLKGLYLQSLFDGTYFSGFGDFDLASIFVVASFLLFYSVVGTTRHIINAIFQAEATEVTTA